MRKENKETDHWLRSLKATGNLLNAGVPGERIVKLSVTLKGKRVTVQKE